MQRVFQFIILTLLLLAPAGVQAQNLVEIDAMQIDLWPEFDRPDVLVIYRLILTDSTPLPAQISIRIPASSGGPYNVAIKDTDGSLYNLDYTTTQDGDWLLVSLTAPASELQIEYYDPGLQRSGNTRQFTFTWAADYTVHALTVQVQQPANASGMQINPDMGAGQVLQDGLTYFTGVFGEVEAGEQFSINLSYDKSDDALSEGFEPVTSSEPINAQTTRTVSFNSVLPWVLGGVGLALVLGVVVWYLVPQRGRQTEKRKRHFSPPMGKATNETGDIYCHNCGAAARPGDTFCHACGAKLRGK